MEKILNTIDNIADSLRNILINMEDSEIKKIGKIEEIVKNYGGDIEEDDTIFRSCIIKKNDSFIIKVSSKLKEKQKRLWIAFELGNLFLNMGYEIDEEKFNKYEEDKIYYNETEYGYDIALLFAISFLTPKKSFIDKMKENYKGDGVYNIQKVAEYFEVDEDVIAIRGKNLGLLAKEDKVTVISKRG